MTFNFKTGNVSVYPNGEVALLLNLPREYQKDVNEINKLVESDKLKELEIKIHREKRSQSANSYAWVLMDKIAKQLSTTSEEIYIKMLGKYGVHGFVAGLPNMEDFIRTTCKIVEVIKDCKINNTDGITYKLTIGSSKYDTLQMSKFIEGIVSDCKELGIQTITPNEIAELVSKWEGEK